MQTPPLSLKSGESLKAPYFQQFSEIVKVISGHPGTSILLIPKAYTQFSCTACGDCCKRPWNIQISQAYYEQWNDYWNNHANPRFHNAFQKLANGNSIQFAELKRKVDLHECLFLDEDNYCSIQKELGEEALSTTCKYFPRTRNWFGQYLGQYLMTGCPETGALLIDFPEFAYDIVKIPTEKWTELQKSPHIFGHLQGYLWIGFQLDVMDYTSWTVAENLRYLQNCLSHILRLGTHNVQQKTFLSLQHDALQRHPHEAPPHNAQALKQCQSWTLHFLDQVKHVQQFVRAIFENKIEYPKLSQTEYQDFQNWLRAYIKMRLAFMPESAYTQSIAPFFQAYFRLSLELCVLQWITLYFRSREQNKLQAQHFIRACNIVGIHYEYKREFQADQEFHKLSPEDALKGMNIFLSQDFRPSKHAKA